MDKDKRRTNFRRLLSLLLCLMMLSAMPVSALAASGAANAASRDRVRVERTAVMVRLQRFIGFSTVRPEGWRGLAWREMNGEHGHAAIPNGAILLRITRNCN